MTPTESVDIAFNVEANQAASAVINKAIRFLREMNPTTLVHLAVNQHPGVSPIEAVKMMGDELNAIHRQAVELTGEHKEKFEQFRVEVQSSIQAAVNVLNLMLAEHDRLQRSAASRKEDKRAKLEKLASILSADELEKIKAEPEPDHAERIALLADRIGQTETYLQSSGRLELPEFVTVELAGGPESILFGGQQ